MRKLYCLLALSLAALALVARAELPTRPQFGHEKSDISPDARVRFGELPNGLRYAVLANHEPKQRTSLRLLVMAGSLNEDESQRGLAHFLEHMAFNGSEHYAPGTLVEYFQRLGMNFGGDTNAYTSFDHTVYMLELPDSSKATMEEGFRVFGDYANSLLLTPEEIDKERGIILSEKRARDSVEFRQMVAEFEFLLGSTRIPKRMPIGLEDVITQSKRDRFAAFYNNWYRPERMAVIAVGDFDADTVVEQLRAAFTNVKPRADAPTPPALGEIARVDGLRATYHHEPEAGATTVGIQTIEPYSPVPDTKARRLELLPRDLATDMLNRRLAILAKKEDAPFNRGTVSSHYGLNYFLNSSIELVCRPEQWAAALGVAEQELRRALQFGFDAGELKEATANMQNALEQAVQTAPTRRSDALARELIQTFVSGDVFSDPSTDLEIYKPALAKITPEQCRDALRAAFAAPGRFVSVMGNAKIEKGSGDAATAPEAQIVAAYQKAAAVELKPSEQQLDAAFAYTEFGATGKIAEQKHVDDLNLDLIRFENGVRLNFKKTDFEAGRIYVTVRVGAGQLIEPRDKQGLGFFASSTFTTGGLGKHSVDDLQRITAGKTVGLGFRVATDALVFSGATNQTDLLLQLQLLAAFVTDPGFRPEALRQARKRFEQIYQQLDHTPNGPLQREVPRLLSSGDSRFGLPPKDALFGHTLDEARLWLEPQLKKGAIEISFVGDLDPAKTLEAAAQTFGALPSREVKPPYDQERQVKMPEAPLTREFTVVTDIPKGVVAIYWPTADARDIKRTRRLNLLANVFTDRLRVQVREKLGESYSPEAASAPDNTYRDYGYMFTYLTIDPAKAALMQETVLAIGDDLAKNGITDDEFARAKKPILTALRESVRTNGYWLGSVLSAAQEHPEHLDWSRSRFSDIESIDKSEVEALARQYLASNRASRFVVVPEKK